MMEKPPTRRVKGVNLTKGKIMLERKVMPREYDGHTAAVGDRVCQENGVEGKVVYVGEHQFAVEIDNYLWIYEKSSSGRLWRRENYVKVNGFLVPAPAEEFTEGIVHIVDPGHVGFTYNFPVGPIITRELRQVFARGLVHRTAANAIAHAKAMLGIDPYARDSLDDAWDEEPAPPAGKGLPETGGDAARLTPPEGSSL